MLPLLNQNTLTSKRSECSLVLVMLEVETGTLASDW